jgi:3-methylcrotonyl-CoA carboxylase alpha subunit
MLASLLIANRGEIACRVIRTAKRMGVRCIAVYSEADAGALHVTLADEAHLIGPAQASESYLNIPHILEAARISGAAAIHPGYGFLSENAEFATACAAAGIVFVGPPIAAIRAMGAKAEAKALMERAGVPVVPGYHDAAQDDARFAEAAQKIGYPVLIKASFGGGGRGMRVVTEPRGLAAALAAARREAEAAFGKDRLILEKYLSRPRHIEVQVFGDTQGNIVSLFERDCSIQRRHQKVVEEAPAFGLSEERRAALGVTAVAAARAVGYVGAGTVEFVAEGEEFYFIEMNTRLQVEHPVTEEISGLDLVEWQLRVASGEALPLTQEQITRRGHAIEVRLYAEDPARDFLPATGTAARFRLPKGSGIRVETGLRPGDAVGVYYDALLAKLIAWGEDRAVAVERLGAALAETRVAGLTTNRDFLLRLARLPAFAAGELDTGFIERHSALLLPAHSPAPFAALAAACLALVAQASALAARQAARTGDPHSPWQRRDGWRISEAAPREMRFHDGGAERAVRIDFHGDGLVVAADGKSAAARIDRNAGGDLSFSLDGNSFTATILLKDDATVVLDDGTWRFDIVNPEEPAAAAAVVAGRLTAPMPGRVIEVLVMPGTAVKRGQLLMLLEAMKMEHSIVAPGDGVVEAVHYAAGDLVAEGALLLDFVAKPD